MRTMRSFDHIIVLLLVALSVGCFRSSANDGDSGIDTDAISDAVDGGVDSTGGGGSSCRYLEELQRCGPTETPECQDCPPRQFCHQGFCAAEGPDGQDDTCYNDIEQADFNPDGFLCSGGRACLQWRYEDDVDTNVRGACASRAACEALPSSPFVTHSCRFFDGTYWEPGGPPPEDECPELSGFCGGPCGYCPLYDQDLIPAGSNDEIACVGVNRQRELGLCSPMLTGNGYRCRRETELQEYGSLERVERDRPMACALFRDPDGEQYEWGWFVFQDACELYASKYPGSVECFRPELPSM